MAERKQRRWLAKRAGSLLFVCRRRKAAGRAVRVPSGDFRKRQKRRGSLFPWNLFFGALKGTLPRPCGQSAGLSAPAGTQGGRTSCSSPFRRLPETTKKKRFCVSTKPLLWCSGTFAIRTFVLFFTVERQFSLSLIHTSKMPHRSASSVYIDQNHNCYVLCTASPQE